MRLFVGCRNQLMAVVDYTNGKVVATVPIGKGVDANRFDPATGLAFASCNDGTIAVTHQDSPDKIQRSPDNHDAAGREHKRPLCLYRDGRIRTATASHTAKSSSLAEGNFEDLYIVFKQTLRGAQKLISDSSMQQCWLNRHIIRWISRLQAAVESSP
jgi:hypothetical protein